MTVLALNVNTTTRQSSINCTSGAYQDSAIVKSLILSISMFVFVTTVTVIVDIAEWAAGCTISRYVLTSRREFPW